MTRNAVIGKVTRLGLPSRQTVRRGVARRSQPTKRRTRESASINSGRVAAKKKECYAPPPPDAATVLLLDEALNEEFEIPKSQRCDLLGLEKNSCRWPVGDPMSNDFYFCGGDAVPGVPYCKHHALRAYRYPSVEAKIKPTARGPVAQSDDAHTALKKGELIES